MSTLKVFGLAVLQSGLVATAISIAAVMLAARLLERFAKRKGYQSASKLVQRFGLVMCAAMVATYLYTAATNVGIALGLWK